MFNEYYFVDKLEQPIYFSIITLNNSIESTLYVGNQLIRRKSHYYGIHVLQKDDIKLKVHVKAFKVIPELSVNNEILKPEKLKRKELRKKLDLLSINNELNPRKIPKKPFEIKSFRMPLVLIFIGGICQVLINSKVKFGEIPSMILFFIAYIYLFSGSIDKLPERLINKDTKGKLKFIVGIAGMIVTKILISKMLNLIK